MNKYQKKRSRQAKKFSSKFNISYRESLKFVKWRIKNRENIDKFFGINNK